MRAIWESAIMHLLEMSMFNVQKIGRRSSQVETCCYLFCFRYLSLFFARNPFTISKQIRVLKTSLIKFVFLVVTWNSEGLGMFIYYFLWQRIIRSSETAARLFTTQLVTGDVGNDGDCVGANRIWVIKKTISTKMLLSYPWTLPQVFDFFLSILFYFVFWRRPCWRFIPSSLQPRHCKKEYLPCWCPQLILREYLLLQWSLRQSFCCLQLHTNKANGSTQWQTTY